MLSALLSWLLVGLGLVLALPVGVFTLQVLAARWRRAPAPALATDRPPAVVLMPAHNEAAIIGATLARLMPCLGPQDRLLVVADNCSDDTAALSRAAGAWVEERQHSSLRGKGHALAFGVAQLARRSPPAVVLIVDADCTVEPGALDLLVRTCLHRGRPAQALYLMHSPPGAGLGQRISEFAWRVRNGVRPRGGAALGMPCQLMGSGMAFSWDTLAAVDLASGSVVEDMQLGLDLAACGRAPIFCELARVDSEFPGAERAAQGQRMRWEHGHLGMLLTRGPGLLLQSLWRRQRELLLLVLDLLVPPLALLCALIAVLLLLSLLVALAGGGLAPLCLAALLSACLTLATGVAWWQVGRDLVAPAELRAIPGYVLGKLPIYARFFHRRQKDWNRTDRG